MQGIMKGPLIIAAIVVVLRVVLERAGVPDGVNNLLSVAALTVVLAPLYFAYSIARSGIPQPYRTHLKLTAVYSVLVRAMILPVYWLGRIFEWPQSRYFGLWGPDVSPMMGFVVVPVATGLIWIVSSIIFGGLLGALIIRLFRK